MQINRSESLFTEFAQKLSKFHAKTSSVEQSGEQDFGSFLASGVRSVNDSQAHSQSQIDALMTGEDVDTADVITSIQKADMAFQLLVQVRNKLMKAYEEIQAINI